MKYVEIVYVSNVYRCTLGTFTFHETVSRDEIIEVAEREAHTKGYYICQENRRLYLCNADELIPFEIEYLHSNVKSTVVVSYIAALGNAYEFERKDGLVFFFHTDERSHIYNPHIHVKCGDEEVSIYLNDNQVKGRFKSPKKLKQAFRYVEANRERILKEWNRILT